MDKVQEKLNTRDCQKYTIFCCVRKFNVRFFFIVLGFTGAIIFMFPEWMTENYFHIGDGFGCDKFMTDNYGYESKRTGVRHISTDRMALRTLRKVKTEPFIRHFIHQTYKDDNIHELNARWMRSWAENHPGWKYYFWTDGDIRRLVVDHYPTYLGMFNSYPHPLQRADAGRYFILHHFGGIYADVDFESLRPLDDYILGKTCILAPEPKEQSLILYNESIIVTNSIMACSKGHPFLTQLIASLPVAYKKHKRIPNSANLDVLYTTGPQQAQNVLEHFRLNDKSGMNVTTADYEELVPTTDHSQSFQFYCNCLRWTRRQGKLQKQACDRMSKTHWQVDDTSRAYTKHHWTHLGYPNMERERKRYAKIPLSVIMGKLRVYRYQSLTEG